MRRLGEAPAQHADHAERGLRSFAQDRLEPSSIDREHPDRAAGDEVGDTRFVRDDRHLTDDVAGMSFPRFDRVPPEGRADRTIILGGAEASRITLPVAT